MCDQEPNESHLHGDNKRSPEDAANWLSLATFHWTARLLWRGYQQPLDLADIPLLHPKYLAADVTVKVQESFKARCAAGEKNPLWGALFSAFRNEFYIGGVCRGIADCLLVMVPFLSRYLIQFTIDSYVARFSDKAGPPVTEGIAYLAGLVVMLTAQSLAHNHYMYLMSVIGGRARAVLCSSIFEKSGNIQEKTDELQSLASDPSGNEKPSLSKQPRTKKEADQDHTPGHIVNLISVDCSRIAQTVSAIHMLWTCPLSCSLAIALLIYNLRESALAGLGLLFLGFFGLIFVVANLFRMRKVIDSISRERVSLLQEVLSGVRLIKLFAWESGIIARINAIRRRETHRQYRYGAVRTFAGAISHALPVMTAMMTFVTYALTSNDLSPAVVFSSTSLFTSLRMPLIYLPLCVQACIDSWASLGRVERFLLMEENVDHPMDPQLKAAAVIQDATFKWGREVRPVEKSTSQDTLSGASSSDDSQDKSFVLQNINLTLLRGELMAVVGAVGSGKTSLLSALAGSMKKSAGTVTWGTSYVICTQQPWILNGTVRENIVFGTAWDPERYQTVVNNSSLARDFLLLPHGDRTIVGERGVVLSGGQKQRITLARAMYSFTECVLLDDPLSAVDAHVSRALLDEAICGFMHDRTRLLCTHDTTVLQRCDRVLWMENGNIRKLDTYHNLVNSDPEFKLFVRGGEDSATADSTTNVNSSKSVSPLAAIPGEILSTDDSAQNEGRTVQSVSWSVYGALISPKASAILFAGCIPFLIVGNGSTIISQLWLSWWSSDRYDLPRNTYIAIYVSLAIAQLLFLFLFGFMLHLACANSTGIMFNRAVRHLLNAPVSFFDHTPLGRHMNRLTSDVDKMDIALPETLRNFAISLTALIPIFTIQIIYYKWFGIAVAVLIVALLALAIYYRSTARETERLESVFRSMVLARVVEGLSGSATLQAYGMYSGFTAKLHAALDDMNAASFSTVAIQRWLSLRQDAVTILALVVLGCLILIKRDTQHPAISGVSISLMINAIQVIQVVVREWAEVEAAMNATDRLHAYANTLPQEEPEQHGSSPQSLSTAKDIWPETGTITMRNLSMKYRPDLPESLKDIDMKIESGEHIAIVGRTGAGKSSVVNALFRFTALSKGEIMIDGRDISKMPLQKLRSSLAIIPQETTLFSGTVRSNLDPFGEHSDDELHTALDKSHLSQRLSLADVITPEGSNLSVGQRQLLALARVLLRRSKILVCDEATSSLDTDTDGLIQLTMKKAFEGKTVICIAHRLGSVLWYDRVVVLDEGRLVEVGTPLELWDRGNNNDTRNDSSSGEKMGGVFRGMCEEAGITRNMAQDAAGWRERQVNEKTSDQNSGEAMGTEK